MLKDKILVVYVTRDNPILVQHAFASFKKYDPGYPCDFLIVDHESTNPAQLKQLQKLENEYKVVTFPNNRVEVSFNRAYQENKDYKYYFFLHDDSVANRDGWLKVFVDRLNSGYAEEIIRSTEFSSLPIGRVGAMHQPWRNYTSILGHSIQCLFLERIIDIMRPGKVPNIFKYADPDRVLVTNECIKATGGILNIADFKNVYPTVYDEVCAALGRYMQYADEGIPPRDLYPPGQHWSKLTVATEFLNSVEPLLEGYRTVGLDGDGFLEQIHGYDQPYGNNYIHHLGAPNMKQFLGRIFNTDPNEVAKQFNNRAFLVQADKAVRKYFDERS